MQHANEGLILSTFVYLFLCLVLSLERENRSTEVDKTSSAGDDYGYMYILQILFEMPTF